MLTKSNYLELQKTFETIAENFKRHIFLYTDEVKVFLEMACSRIGYFRKLSPMTQMEMIYSMERKTYEKGHLLLKEGEIAGEMFIIQEGIIEVAVPYSSKIETPFILERLGSGAVINHRAFMLEDDADTDFRCLTTVSCFELPLKKLLQIREKKQDMKQAFIDVEFEQV